MAGKSVATQADVQAQPGTVPYTGAVSGTWTAGSVSVSAYAKLTISGMPAIHAAKCTFSFSGKDSNGVDVVGAEDVILSAAALGVTRLQGGEQQVLRDGDQSNTSLYGNVIRISASEKLSSG